MSSTLARSTRSQVLGARAVTRRVAREIKRSRAYGDLVAGYEIANVETVEKVTQASLLAASNISAVEDLLADRTPNAAARLRHIADASSIVLSSIVFETKERF